MPGECETASAGAQDHRAKGPQAGYVVRQAQSEFFPVVSLVGNYARFGDTMSLSGTEYKKRKLAGDGGSQLEFLGMGKTNSGLMREGRWKTRPLIKTKS